MNEQPSSEVKRATCCHCAVACGVLVEVVDDQPLAIRGDSNHPITQGFICRRGQAAIDYFHHPGRVNRPRKRVGDRGADQWIELRWDEALDEIAEQLRTIIDRDGPEAMAYASGTFHGPDQQIGNRFLNYLGSPNAVGTYPICGGPTLEAEALTYGWGGSQAEMIPETTRFILLWGRHPSASNPPAWGRIRATQQTGATLMVIDPRQTQEADHADLWLRPRPGTDAALALGFLHVIIAEERYDRDFVARWTVGFDALATRVQEYAPDRVAALTGVLADDIRRGARLYATHQPAALLPSLPIGMGRNALNWTRAMACLIAICGNLDVPGGHYLAGPVTNVLTLKDICDYPALVPQQRAKRLGADRFRLNHEGYERLNTAMQRVWYGKPYTLMQDVGAAAHPPTLWRTILSEQPYPVRALFVQHNNVLGCYPNARLIYDALKSPNLNLLVVHEQWMTPTAQLADYILPAAGWLEKPFLSMHGQFATEAVVPEYAERRSDYQLWADLAVRIDIQGTWPSALEGLYDLMLAPVGARFADLTRETKPLATSQKHYRRHEELDPEQGQPRGFGTPTGKVELRSTILHDLGYDPLPSFEEPLVADFGSEEEYPFLLSTGTTVIEMTHQDHRQIPALRRRHPEPTVEIPPEIATTLTIETGEWVWVETPKGRIRQQAKVTPGLHPHVVVAERWWYPEREGADPELYGFWESNINAYTEDAPELCDPAYGNWPFRLGRCRVSKA